MTQLAVQTVVGSIFSHMRSCPKINRKLSATTRDFIPSHDVLSPRVLRATTARPGGDLAPVETAMAEEVQLTDLPPPRRPPLVTGLLVAMT